MADFSNTSWLATYKFVMTFTSTYLHCGAYNLEPFLRRLLVSFTDYQIKASPAIDRMPNSLAHPGKPVLIHSLVHSSSLIMFILKTPSSRIKRLLAYWLIGLITLSCSIQDHVTPMDTCQLAQIVNGGGPNAFTYDAAGVLTRWVITTPVSTTTTDIVQYDFSRDEKGRISSLTQSRTFDGKSLGTATAQFTYTNGLLTSTSTTVDPAQPGSISRTFTYDNNGRMSQRVVLDKTSGFTSTETYEYDSRGNCTRYTYTDSYGTRTELVNTYDTSKNPEQLLIKSIPFNLLTGRPWSVNAPLMTKETYADFTGLITYTSNQTDLKTDATGYVTSFTLTYNDGYVGKTSYSRTGCQ